MNKIFAVPGRMLDQTGMYRVVTLSLLFLVACSLFLAVTGQSAYSWSEQLISLLVVVVTALVVNVLFSKLFKIDVNNESALITALILFFLFAPGFAVFDHQYVAIAAAAGVASKFLIASKRQHIFNAAAFGAVVLSIDTFVQDGSWYEAWWWVASPEMLVPLLLVGVAVVSKVRRWAMVWALILGAVIVTVAHDFDTAIDLGHWYRFFVTGPTLFLAFFMLTEPFTTPPTKKLQIGYGFLVGALMSTTLFSPVVGMTPELALVIGNLAVYPFLLRQKLFLKYVERSEIAKDTWEFVFEKPTGMRFLPGQYLEWMLPHEATDSRGVRRYFTIASAPEEEYVRLGFKTAEGGSRYKEQLMQLKPGDEIIASQLAGDFLLPADAEQKIACVAGGIGVTPFRSFIGHFLETNDTRDTVLYYANNTHAEIAYSDVFKRAELELGLQWVNVLAKETHVDCEHGYLTPELVTKHTPDYKERVWYLSGPPGMVHAYKILLKQIGVPSRNIVTDFFPGLA